MTKAPAPTPHGLVTANQVILCTDHLREGDEFRVPQDDTSSPQVVNPTKERTLGFPAARASR